jgi:hypothetical protein
MDNKVSERLNALIEEKVNLALRLNKEPNFHLTEAFEHQKARIEALTTSFDWALESYVNTLIRNYMRHNDSDIASDVERALKEQRRWGR